MEDYFVIILTLIIAVVGALNSKKKKKAPQTPTADGAGQPSDFWDIIMDQQEEELIEEPVAEYVEPEPVAESFDEQDERLDYSLMPSKEGESAIQKPMKTTPAKRRKVLIDGEEFSLKKAVIYSEIMNRKYS